MEGKHVRNEAGNHSTFLSVCFCRSLQHCPCYYGQTVSQEEQNHKTEVRRQTIQIQSSPANLKYLRTCCGGVTISVLLLYTCGRPEQSRQAVISMSPYIMLTGRYLLQRQFVQRTHLTGSKVHRTDTSLFCGF